MRLLRTYTDFPHVVKLLRMYTAFFFTVFNAEILDGSDLEDYFNLSCPLELLVIHLPNSLEVTLLVLIEQYFPVE